MTDETLERQIKDMAEKMRMRDEAERKKVEAEWRKAMERDTAGHMLKMFQYTEARFADFQAQLDAANPMMAIVRGLNARLAAIEAALAEAAKKEEEATT